MKLKSPPHSAGQSYTLNLPDTNIEAGKFLKVTSKTGSVVLLQDNYSVQL